MKKTAIMEIVAKLDAMYPAAFKDYTEEKFITLVDAWADMFEDETDEDVKNAVKNLTRTMKFCPTISEICEELNRIKSTAKVKKDMCNADVRGTTLQMLETIYGKDNVPDDVLEMEVKEREAFYREIAK